MIERSVAFLELMKSQAPQTSPNHESGSKMDGRERHGTQEERFSTTCYHRKDGSAESAHLNASVDRLNRGSVRRHRDWTIDLAP